MGLYKPEYVLKKRTPSRYRLDVIGYRTYANADRLGFADRNCQRFRRLLLDLKEGDLLAIELFAVLLGMIFDEVLASPTAVLCVPCSRESEPTRHDPVARVVRTMIEMGVEARDGSSWLQRTKTVPRAHDPTSGMRSVEKQMESIACVLPTDQTIPRSVVIIDDIYTSGSTMIASAARVRERLPNTEVLGFAFGRTAFVPENSPRVPVFPAPRQSPDIVDDISEQWLEEAWPLPLKAGQSPFLSNGGEVHHYWCPRIPGAAEPIWSKADATANLLVPCVRCRPFAEKPIFVLNRYSQTIHQVGCHTGPTGSGGIDLWSLREGIRLGGRPCVNCMHRWPVAMQLHANRGLLQ
jgi:predicted amidophosphoribosyltransferase